MKKQYSPTFKAQVVIELLKEDKTITEIAAEYGVHPTQLHRWKETAVKNMARLFVNGGKEDKAARAAEKKIDELYAEVGRLTTQLKWLKKKSGIEPE